MLKHICVAISGILCIAISSASFAACYVVGTWNLEHFKTGATRGFPEYSRGGARIPARTDANYQAIAVAIRDKIDAKILILNEINGRNDDTSEELDILIGHLGNGWEYRIASSGGGQRIAIIFDTKFSRLNAAKEMAVVESNVQGKDIFERDPLIAHFTFLQNGNPRNDLTVVGLHLASGQQLTQNHDDAMATLGAGLNSWRRANDASIPRKEVDVLIGGDLNASWYDRYEETLFNTYNANGWKVLAPARRGADYPGTRLAGVPLKPTSQIDYLMVTRVTEQRSGLYGEEIDSSVATVHHELAESGWAQFRRVYSDHFPVTTCIRVQTDTDPDDAN
jgi:endonuclease/exonuclease/phosphatase family metal-dependent hydrolase